MPLVDTPNGPLVDCVSCTSVGQFKTTSTVFSMTWTFFIENICENINKMEIKETVCIEIFFFCRLFW